MQNIYLIIFVTISSIQISMATITSDQMIQSFSLINVNLINQCISYDDILESGEYGYKAIVLNKDLLKYMVEHTLKDNYPKINYDIQYYFYDSRTYNSCNINGSICNSVQISIRANYKNISTNKTKRFELIEKKQN